MNDRMVTREHRQEISCVGKREVVGEVDLHTIFKVNETYDGAKISHWVEDEDGKIVRRCGTYKCVMYAYVDASKHGFCCVSCVAKHAKAATRVALDRDYKKAVSKSILKIAAVCREKHPTWNVRKGRKKDTLVYDGPYSDREKRLDGLRVVARTFNCKLGSDICVDNDTCSYNRRQVKVLDDSPFKDVVFDET